MEARKRRILSISEKVELIKLMEEKPKNKRAVAAKFGIPLNTVATIYASRERILAKCKGDYTNMNLKRLRPSTYPDIEESLLDWYIENHANRHISCLTLRAKALQVAKYLGYDNFTASNGWIERFKTRHNLKFQRKKDKNGPHVFENVPIDFMGIDTNKSDISQNGNSSEIDTFDQNKLDQDQSMKTIHNQSLELAKIKQECDDNELHCESHCSLNGKEVDKLREFTTSPSHILPEIHWTESIPNNENFFVNDSYTNSELSNSNFTIRNVEKAYDVIQKYINNSSESVDDKTLGALTELKSFISREKERKTQTKITDFFSCVKVLQNKSQI